MIKKWLAYPMAYSAKIIFRFLLWSCRVKIEGLERFAKTAEKEPCILMLWHNRLGLVPEILNRYAPPFNYVAFVSKSRDGELLAILAESYALGRTIRVPSNNRHHALKQSIDRLKKGDVLVFTPDGPRGPRYEVKPGIALAARAASATIIPLTWKADRFWQLKTWDGFLIPKPFAKVHVQIGDPIAVSKDVYPDLNQLTDKLQDALLNS